MDIPARIKGLTYNFTFQFDLGANLTRFYEENTKSVLLQHPNINFKKPGIVFGDFTASSQNCYIQKGYGEAIILDSLNKNAETRIGTIGSDMFKNKVLIIDYPNQRFSICDTMPSLLCEKMIDITLDKYGRIILPMLLKGKKFKVLFDNGSSIFSLLTSVDKINNFSTEQDVDTMQIRAWGDFHLVIGRPLKDTFILAGQKYANITAYADHSDKEATDQYDAITGNALFWDKTVVIDFRNKKFGLR